jgi:hypothetical protein
MGDYSYILEGGNIAYADIGKFCSIAAHVRINPGNHPNSDAFDFARKYDPDRHASNLPMGA